MEIEKTRETSWRIQLKKRDENIEITSVEISGEVRIIKIGINEKENSVKVQMNKEEFFNFLSLISAFKEVVIGEGTIFIEDEPTRLEIESQQLDDVSNLHSKNFDPSEKNFKDEKKDELNPEEWDPW
ncbi:hypothetical protein LCGC14_0557170 [marine sediment metagenome]|uniref:Uncharacterized protein n=1 Tax=marine sediment metagenome TaxID=412755 RepID=A0A0F9RT76_9ZZZZ